MYLAVVIIRLRQLFFSLQQGAEPVAGAQLILDVHLDGIERADLNADLAAHADRDVNVEGLRLELQLASVVGFPGGVLDDIDALGRTFLLADQASHAAQALLPIFTIMHQEREVARRLCLRQPLLGILYRHEPVFLDVTAQKVPRRLRHAFEDALAQHGRAHRSTSPITISTLPRMITTSAT